MPDAKNPTTTPYVSSLECALCRTSGAEVQLLQCRICRRRFCDNCAYHSRTGLFCSQDCSLRFFFGDADEDDLGDEERDYDDE